ncbi:MAG: MFS transporter [Marmoricola sp.]
MTGRVRAAVALSFLLNGFAFASWASRIPDARHGLGLSAPELGLLLLAASGGSVLALPLTGLLVHRLGATRVVQIGTLGAGIGVSGIALATSMAGSVPATAVAMFVYGVGTSLWDVAMNVEAAAVERALNRSVMPRFHAAFSLGTVAGAGLGALMSKLSPDLVWHLPPVGLVAVVCSLAATRAFVPTRAETDPGRGAPSGVRAAWLERRTLLIGLVVLAMALTEGTANDWLAVGLHDGYDVSRPVAVVGYALFVASMTLGRLAGPVLLDRFDRVGVLFGTMAAAGAGVVLTVLGGSAWLAVPGIVAWGLGASLGFPVGMTAAADDPARAAARVSVVSTIGYGAFLIGPPLLGFVAGHVGTLHALLVLLAFVVPAVLAVPAIRRPR